MPSRMQSFQRTAFMMGGRAQSSDNLKGSPDQQKPGQSAAYGWSMVPCRHALAHPKRSIAYVP